MRGLAVIIMIQCHVFNSFARMDVREGGPYVLSQFVGGMAAPIATSLPWGGTPALIQENLVPSPGRLRFPSFRSVGGRLQPGLPLTLLRLSYPSRSGSSQSRERGSRCR
jgi:hypothetical protein